MTALANPPRAKLPTPPLSTEMQFERFHLLVLAGITLLAGVLRLYKLGEWSLWVDEGHTYRDFMVSSETFWAERSGVRNYPLSYLMMRGLSGWFGSLGEGWLRLPFAFFGIMSVPTLAIVGRSIVGRTAAIGAAALLAVNPWHIYWSQNCRSYAMVLFFAMVAAGAYWHGFRTRSIVMHLLAIIGVIVAGLCHPSAWLLGLVFLVHALLARLRVSRDDVLPRQRWMTVAVLVVIALAIPLAVQFLYPLMQQFQRAKPDSSLPHLLTTTAYFLRVPLLIAAIGGAVWLVDRGVRAALFLSVWVAVPLTVFSIFATNALDFITFKVTAQYALWVLPAVCLLAGCAILAMHEHLRAPALRGKILRLLPASLLVLDMLAYDALYFTKQYGDRPRWREAAQAVAHAPGTKKLVLTTNEKSLYYYFGTTLLGKPAAGGLVTVGGLQTWAMSKSPLTDKDYEAELPGDEWLRRVIQEALAQDMTVYTVVCEPELFEMDRSGRLLGFMRGEMQFVSWLQNWTGPKDMNVFVFRMR